MANSHFPGLESKSDSQIEMLLKKALLVDLQEAGWQRRDGIFVPPRAISKEQLRKLHYPRRLERTQQELKVLKKYVPELLNYFASAKDINPENFDLELIRVNSDTKEGLLFRFATLLWSIPVSQGFGRRMRYLAKDKSNNKLVGLLALGDPVFNLKVRDMEIGWNVKERERFLYHVMDAYVLGAVPPYNFLLGGKLIALAATSNEIRADFWQRYSGARSIIRGEVRPAYLVLITVTSALGRSSIYRRLRFSNEIIYRSVGYTTGYGHFHISNETFALMREWLHRRGDSYWDSYAYGEGPNWRFRVIRKTLDLLGYGGNHLTMHNIGREVFIAPLAKNYKQFLQGKESALEFYDRPLKELVAFFKERWLLPRAQRVNSWKDWEHNMILEQIVGNTLEV